MSSYTVIEVKTTILSKQNILLKNGRLFRAISWYTLWNFGERRTKNYPKWLKDSEKWHLYNISDDDRIIV